MKRVELQAHFSRFYHRTYPQAMAYCLAKTGDFINSEDLLSETYYAVYKYFLNKKDGVKDPDRYLFTVLKNQIDKYWKKHRKDKQENIPPEEYEQLTVLLETELDLTAEKAVKQMLIQDVLEFVSTQPALLRRAFAIHFYLGMTIEETAEELELPVATARNYIYHLLKKVREEFLEDFE